MPISTDPLHYHVIQQQMIALDLSKGDTLVLRIDETLTAEQVERVYAAYALHLPSQMKMLVLPEGVSIEVRRAEK